MPPVTVAILVNPISGAGRGDATAERLGGALREAGHGVEVLETPRGSASEASRWLQPRLAGSDAMVVVGGDGAIRLSCVAAAQAGTPIYHVPCGTENLFAREWRMDRSETTLLRSINRMRVVHVDLGRANGEPFLLMASVGFDAEVVHDLAAHRRGSISHLTYARPIWRQLRRYASVPLQVTIDGAPVDGPRGCVVAGNCRQYAGRLNPAVHADMSDGELDVVCYPSCGRARLLGWIAVTALRLHEHRRGLVYHRGRQVVVRSEAPFRFQLDGDPADQPPTDRLELMLEPGVVPVLVPEPGD